MTNRLDPTRDQLVGAEFLASKPRAILADDTGYGKTLQLILAASLVGAKRILFVTGAQASMQVADEVPRLGLRYTVKALRMAKSKRRAVYVSPPDVLVLGYETFRSDAELLSKMDWDVVILDDASKFKNAESGLSKAAVLVTEGVSYVWASTASPIENSLVDLWSIFHAINFYPLGDYEEFSEAHLVLDSMNALYGQAKVIGYSGLEEVKEKIRPYMIRRILKEGPSPNFHMQEVDLHRNQQRLYMAARRGAFGRGVYNRFNQVLQFCDTSAFGEEDPRNWESTKIDVSMELIRALEGSKIVVYSMWLKTIGHLKRELQLAGIPFVEISGKVAPEIRHANVTRFTNDPRCRLCLVTRAAEQALNLQAAQYMILLNRLTNPQRMKQVQGRIRRRGSSHAEVHFIDLVVRNSLEYRVLELLRSRSDLYADVIGSLENLDPILMSNLLEKDEESNPDLEEEDE